MPIRRQGCGGPQYSNNFAEIFGPGLARIEYFAKRRDHVEWAVVACYLTLLSALPDAHIQRKHGRRGAENVAEEAKALATEYQAAADPVARVGLLQDFDRRLKAKNYNPGTTADLTAASLFVYNLLAGPAAAHEWQDLSCHH